MVAGKEPLVGVPEIAEYLGLSRNTIYKMVKEGSIPAYKVGNKLRFSYEEVAESLEEVKEWTSSS